MRIFVAGATGVVGRELLPQLYADGYQVAGMTSHPERADFVRRLGATRWSPTLSTARRWSGR